MKLGLDSWDKVNVIAAGGNYGWPQAEGNEGAGGKRPIYVFRPAQASPAGLAYAGGAIWMGAMRGQALWRLPVAGQRASRTAQPFFVQRYGRIRTVKRAPDGSLWITTSNTDRLHLGRAPQRQNDDRILRVELTPRA